MWGEDEYALFLFMQSSRGTVLPIHVRVDRDMGGMRETIFYFSFPFRL